MILFHYCSTSTFFNIVKGRTIWLSSLSSSNDTLEGRWLSVILRTLCERKGMPPTSALDLARRFQMLERINDCLGFCLSEKGDMLSQWRGYAEDATGVSIGFNMEAFESVAAIDCDRDWPLRLQKVVYEEEDQLILLNDRFEPIEDLVGRGAAFQDLLASEPDKGTIEEHRASRNRNDLLISKELVGLTDLLYTIKNPAFAEELEWRFVREIDGGYRNVDFRTRGDRIVPYQALELPADRQSVIDHVFVGPRNPTPAKVISQFLNAHHMNCPVYPSTATYRR